MSAAQRDVLEKLSRSRTAPAREVQRAGALVLAADGVANMHVAARVGASPTTIAAWRERFSAEA